MADCWETLICDGIDLQSLGWIVSAEGLLSTGPRKGDLIEMDWQAGAIWQPGPRDTYSFDVPLVLSSKFQDVALGRLRTIQAMQGTAHQLIRRLTVDGEQIEEYCDAVMISAPRVDWDFKKRSQIMVICIFQSLTGYWIPVS